MPYKSGKKWKWGNLEADTKKDLAHKVWGVWKKNGSKGDFGKFFETGHIAEGEIMDTDILNNIQKTCKKIALTAGQSRISLEVNGALIGLAELELTAARLYAAASVWAAVHGLTNMKAAMMRESADEFSHYHAVVKFISDMSGIISDTDIQTRHLSHVSTSDELAAIFDQIYTAECTVEEGYKTAVNTASASGDQVTENWLATKLEAQILATQAALEFKNKAQNVNCGAGLISFDELFKS